MLNRRDLASQFELIVKQEIKNHNDQILVTNQAINDLRSQIQILNNKFSENIARQEHFIKKFDSEFKNFESLIKMRDQRLEGIIDSLDNKYQKIQFDNERKLQNVEDDTVTRDEIQDFLDTCRNEIHAMKKEIHNQKEFSHASMFNIKSDLDRIFREFVDDFQNRPNELWEVKQELEGKIKSALTDAQGILKEIHVCNKSVFIVEKNIENLYTLIKKLKEEIAAKK